MKFLTHKKILMLFMSLFSALILSSCKSVDTDSIKLNYEGQTLYNKVGLHAEWRGSAFLIYSTNYIGVPTFFKYNTEFKVKKVFENEIILTETEKNNDIILRYNFKHNRMPFKSYLAETFSKTKISLPSSITKIEEKNIEVGKYVPGMSREALFYSIGYPPASLNSNRLNNVLLYQSKKFNKVKIVFDDKYKIVSQDETKN